MDKCNPVQTPMELGLKLSKAEHEREINATRFRRNVKCLRYLLTTRPDLSFSVGVLSRYMQSLRESHGAAMKQILRYLRGSLSYGLTFERSTMKVPRLIGYSDNSFVSDPDDGETRQAISSTLEKVRSRGVHKNRRQSHCLPVRLNTWHEQRLQCKLFGYKIYYTRSLVNHVKE